MTLTCAQYNQTYSLNKMAKIKGNNKLPMAENYGVHEGTNNN